MKKICKKCLGVNGCMCALKPKKKSVKFKTLMKDIEDAIAGAKPTSNCLECDAPLRDPNPGELSLDDSIVGICTKCRLHYCIVDDDGTMMVFEPNEKVFNRIN